MKRGERWPSTSDQEYFLFPRKLQTYNKRTNQVPAAVREVHPFVDHSRVRRHDGELVGTRPNVNRGGVEVAPYYARNRTSCEKQKKIRYSSSDELGSCNCCQDSGEAPLMQRRLGSGTIQKLRCETRIFRRNLSKRVSEMLSRNPHQDFTTRTEGEWKMRLTPRCWREVSDQCNAARWDKSQG